MRVFRGVKAAVGEEPTAEGEDRADGWVVGVGVHVNGVLAFLTG